MLRASWRAFRPTVRPFIFGEPLAPPLPMHLLSWEHACVLSVFGSALAPRRAQALTRNTQAVRHSTPALLHRAFRRATRPCKVTRLVCSCSSLIRGTPAAFPFAHPRYSILVVRLGVWVYQLMSLKGAMCVD